ncbi:ankyrin repeat domain-containing protein [bacterium]|nr:ankyrin repeat domain-containing protein [bacterium]
MKHILITTIAAVLVVGCKSTSIHEAAYTGNIEAVKQHLATGTDVNVKMKTFGWTPLHFATIKEIVELLIAKGADVNAEDDDGKTPLDWATGFRRTKIADLLRKHGGKTGVELSIHKATGDGNFEAVKQHLAVGTKVDTKDGDGITPLSWAARDGHKEIVELLIAKGADVNAKAEDGHTPLEWAISEGKIATADLLRKYGGKTGEQLKAEGK